MRPTIFHVLVLVGALATLSPSSAPAQTAEEQVQATVESFLETLGGLRHYALSKYMASGTSSVTIARKTPAGFENRVMSALQWLETAKRMPNDVPFEERLSNIEIRVESGQLAVLTADFEIVRSGEVRSSGVDVFTLVKQGDEWKFASIAYTSLPTETGKE